jgi:hypothetical protein
MRERPRENEMRASANAKNEMREHSVRTNCERAWWEMQTGAARNA